MGGKEEKERGAWSNQLEFILTCIGFAVGLGNVWRFPYLCYKHGGGAFLIPYFTCLIIIGIPVFYLELCFGQFASLGPLKIWTINPALKGLGYAMVIVSALIAIYYCMVIAWCLYYFFVSMTSVLPWSSCDNSWNTCGCRVTSQNTTLINMWGGAFPSCVNSTTDFNATKTASEEFWNNRALEATSGIDDIGTIKWDLCLCLLLAWIICFLVLSKGVQSLGKVVYFTAIFPYILLTVLLIRGLTLDGHYDGIMYYLKPDPSKLMNADAWSDAAVQIFYSLSTCSGGLIAMASYNKFNNLTLRDTFLIPIINCLTSFYAGFVIFAVLGFMAHAKGVSVDKVATDGPGLTFVVYPEGLAQMPVAPLWSILFFFMMATLGFSSLFSIVETVITGLIDELAWLRKNKWLVIGFRFAICTLGFLLGLPMATHGGSYLLNVQDTYVGGFPLLFIGLFEFIAIIYVYGFFRFKSDIEMMLGRNICISLSFIYFGVTWIFLSPVALMAIIILKARGYTPIKGDPPFATALGWLMVAAVLFLIPVWFILYTCIKGAGKICYQLNSPLQSWGPAEEKDRTGKYASSLPFTDYTNMGSNDAPAKSHAIENYYQDKVDMHSVTSPGSVDSGIDNNGYSHIEPNGSLSKDDDSTKF